MVPSINNQLPTLSPPSAMSGHKQARDTREMPYSAGKTVSMAIKTTAPNSQNYPAHQVLHTRGLTGTKLQFRVDETTDQVVITVLQRDTGEIIREIPVKEPFSLAPTLDAVQAGQVFHAVA